MRDRSHWERMKDKELKRWTKSEEDEGNIDSPMHSYNDETFP